MVRFSPFESFFGACCTLKDSNFAESELTAFLISVFFGALLIALTRAALALAMRFRPFLVVTLNVTLNPTLEAVTESDLSAETSFLS